MRSEALFIFFAMLMCSHATFLTSVGVRPEFHGLHGLNYVVAGQHVPAVAPANHRASSAKHTAAPYTNTAPAIAYVIPFGKQAYGYAPDLENYEIIYDTGAAYNLVDGLYGGGLQSGALKYGYVPLSLLGYPLKK